MVLSFNVANDNIYSEMKFEWRMSCFALLVLLEEIICFSQQMHYENTFYLCIGVHKNSCFEEICVTSLLQDSLVW